MKVYLEPDWRGVPDAAHGGVRRVSEAMRKFLPEHHVELVDDWESADLINVHVTPKKGVERYLKANPHVPFVASSHGLYWAEYANWPNWCYKTNRQCMELYRLADALTAPSEWVAQTLRRNTLRPVGVVGHGIDLEEWTWPLTIQNEGYVLWNKTRADPVCDPLDMVNLARMAPNTQFLTTFSSTEDTPNIKQIDVVPYFESRSIIQRAGVYLCTARETFGIGTLEAMAAGVPILGWNFGGQKEIVEHKVTGWLSTPGDFDDLRRGLDYCLEHRKELGQAARQEIEEHYQWKDVVSGYAEIFREVLSATKFEGPKVSVIVPAYGLDEFLPETLESVKQQSYDDWECIVVDDASPDRCGEIADEFAGQDSRFAAIHNDENEYLAGALNTGIAAARGRYILPLDADNLIHVDTLRDLASALDNDRTIDIAYGNVEFLDPDGRRWHSGWPPEFDAQQQIFRGAGERPRNLIPSTSMYRKKVWGLTGGYRRRWKTAEDADFWTRATSYGLRASRVTTADTLVYRNRADSMSREEKIRDWTLWFPWAREDAAPPAAAHFPEQLPVPSLDPSLVSVIIPVGPGHEKLLVDALDSVDAQTFRMWECIVVNDTGGELPWLPSWAKLIETEGKVGVARARNMGISQSGSKLFLPLDADDTLEPEALAILHRSHREHGGYIYPDWYERWSGEPIKVWECEDYDPRALLRKGCLHSVTALYEKAHWAELGGFNEELPAWEDWDFQLKLANIAVCGTRVNRPLFTYRKDTGFRREENYADFESSKAAILDIWKPYFDGRRELMACGGCRRKAAQQAMAQQEATPALPSANSDFIVLEYTGAKQGSRTFKAPSGTIYRFSALSKERKKLVRRGDDANFFLSRPEFKVAEQQEAVPV